MEQRIAIIPTSIISGLTLALAGGFYVWHETASPPMTQNINVMTPSAAVELLPASAAVATQELALELNPDNPSDTKSAPIGRGKGQSAFHEMPELEATAAAELPIRIEHSHVNEAVDPMLVDAWDAYRNGDFDTASQHYSEVLRKDVQNHNTPTRDALLGLAAIAQQRAQDVVATQYYTQLLTLDPRDPDAYAGMSSLLGTTEAAGTESRLKLLIAQRPEAAALHFALGNYYAEQSSWGDAEQAFFSACELESDNAQFSFNLAVSLDHLGQGKLAIQHYQQALRLDHVNNPAFDHAQVQLRMDKLLMLP